MAKVVPASQGIIKGKRDDIPEELLNRSRTSYNWDEFEVGDHKEFSLDEFPKARSSAIAFGRGTKERAPRTFASRTVTKKQGNTEVKVGEIWRLDDPVSTPTTSQQSNRPNAVN